MPIHFNSPEHIKEMQEVKPLTLEEEQNIVNEINDTLLYLYPGFKDNLQRLIWNYENYKHAYISSRSLTEDIEVIYTVESKNYGK